MTSFKTIAKLGKAFYHKFVAILQLEIQYRTHNTFSGTVPLIIITVFYVTLHSHVTVGKGLREGRDLVICVTTVL